MSTAPPEKQPSSSRQTRRTEGATKSGVVSVCCVGAGALIPAEGLSGKISVLKPAIRIPQLLLLTWEDGGLGWSRPEQPGSAQLARRERPQRDGDEHHHRKHRFRLRIGRRICYTTYVSRPYLVVSEGPRPRWLDLCPRDKLTLVALGSRNAVESGMAETRGGGGGAAAAKIGDCSDTATAHRRREGPGYHFLRWSAKKHVLYIRPISTASLKITNDNLVRQGTWQQHGARKKEGVTSKDGGIGGLGRRTHVSVANAARLRISIAGTRFTSKYRRRNAAR